MAEPDTKLELNDKDLDTLQNKISEEQKARLEQRSTASNKAGGETASQERTPQAIPTPHQGSVVIKNLRTFQGDIAEAIKNQDASVLSIAMAEQSRAGRGLPAREEKVSGPTSFVERIMGKRQEPKAPSGVKPLAEAMPLKAPASAPTPSFSEKIAATPTKAPRPIQPRPERNFERIVLSPGKEARKEEIRRNILTIAVSIILIVLGISTVLGFYFLQKRGTSTLVQEPSEMALLRYQSQETITLTGESADELARALATVRQEKNLPEHDTLYLVLNEEVGDLSVPLTTTRLFSLLRTQIPASLLRAMENEFMFGLYAHEGNQPFLLIPLSSFENGFDGMLRWEKTLNQDLGDLFSSRTIPITEYSDAQGTTTATTTRLIYVDNEAGEEFEDKTIRNKDIRILKNTRGDTLLLYSFLDKDTLLITSTEGAFQEILNKFLSEKRGP